jgi:hypothetical protein
VTATEPAPSGAGTGGTLAHNRAGTQLRLMAERGKDEVSAPRPETEAEQ